MPEIEKVPVAAPVAAALPPTESERKKARLEAIAKEDDATRFARRAAELKVHLDVHFLNVNEAHVSYPTRQIPFEKMTVDEQKRWNAKRHQIDMANKAYHRIIKQTCADHRAEDIHLAKLREANAKN